MCGQIGLPEVTTISSDSITTFSSDNAESYCIKEVTPSSVDELIAICVSTNSLWWPLLWMVVSPVVISGIDLENIRLGIKTRSLWYWLTLSLPVRKLLSEPWNTRLIHADMETWEPFIQSLFQLQPRTGVRVGEVWSSECPNHGQSAIVNEEALLNRLQGICPSPSFRYLMTWLTRCLYSRISMGPRDI